MAMKVCILEDDPLMLQHLSTMVTDLGCEVLPAGSVDQALALVREHRPQAAVIDILMPDKDGLNFIMEVGRDLPLRIVAITGGGRLAPSALLRMAEGLGAHATLIKPFSGDDLRMALALDADRP